MYEAQIGIVALIKKATPQYTNPANEPAKTYRLTKTASKATV
jgi:hypothetical protein